MKYLILGPAGIGFFTMLGAFSEMENRLDELKEISGSSAGALLGFMFLSGKTSKEILDTAISINMKSLTTFNLKTFLSNYGFVDNKPIKEILYNISSLTFIEFFKLSNIKFHVAAYCLNKSSTEYFSVDSHPNMIVADAICMSISIPIYFQGCVYNDLIYVDGSMSEDLPALPFISKNQDDIYTLELISVSQVTQITNYKDFIKTLIVHLFTKRHEYPLKNKTILHLPENVSVIDFSLSNDKLIQMFMSGFNQARIHSGFTK